VISTVPPLRSANRWLALLSQVFDLKLELSQQDILSRSEPFPTCTVTEDKTLTTKDLSFNLRMGQYWAITAPRVNEALHFGKLGEILFDGSAQCLVPLLAMPVLPVDSA